MCGLITIFAILAAPPCVIAPQSDPGTVSDGDFEAVLTLTPVDLISKDSDRPIMATVKLRLEGKRGSHPIRNPFFDERLACTCHIIVYDGSLTLVGLFPLHRGVDSTPDDRVKDRTMLTPGRAFGRTVSLSIPRRASATKQPLYAQAVMLKAILNGYGTIEPIDSSSVASYQTSISNYVAGVSSPIQLRHGGGDVQRDDTSSAILTIELRDTQPGKDRSKLVARLTNDSSDHIYAPYDLFLPLAGWVGGPSLVAEKPDGARLEIDDGRAHWPHGANNVLRLPPGSFIECDRSFRAPEVLRNANAPRRKEPLSIRLVDIVVLQRRAPTEDFGLTVSRPSADNFSRVPIAPSNSIPLLDRTQ